MAKSQPVSVDVEGTRLSLSNLDKVLYPQTRTTKGEVIDYYARIAPAICAGCIERASSRASTGHRNGDTRTSNWRRGSSPPPPTR